MNAIPSGSFAPVGRFCPVMWLKFFRLFGRIPEFWMRLQAEYDLKKAPQNKSVMERVARIVPLTKSTLSMPHESFHRD